MGIELATTSRVSDPSAASRPATTAGSSNGLLATTRATAADARRSASVQASVHQVGPWFPQRPAAASANAPGSALTRWVTTWDGSG